MKVEWYNKQSPVCGLDVNVAQLDECTTDNPRAACLNPVLSGSSSSPTLDV